MARHILLPVIVAHGVLGPALRLWAPPEIARQGREEWRIGREAELCDGTVLFSGGTSTQSTYERYNPPALGRR